MAPSARFARIALHSGTALDDTKAAAPSVDAPTDGPRSIWRSPYLWAFFAGVLFLTLLRPLLKREPAPPPVLGVLPRFTLISQSGQPFGSDELSGQVFVCDFIFTRCASICPRLTEAMRRLDERYAAEGVSGVKLVSISVDPEYDRPELLTAYAAAHGIEPGRWSLLTGEPAAVRALLVEGFRVPTGDPVAQGGLVDIAHSGKFVLVDGESRIRGYYDTDAQGLDEIFHRSRQLLAEARR